MPLDFTKSTIPPPSLGRKPRVEPGFVPEPPKPTLSQVKAGLRRVGGKVGGYEDSSFDRKRVEEYKAHYRAQDARAARPKDPSLPVEPTREQLNEFMTHARHGVIVKPSWVPSDYEPWTLHKCAQLAAAMKGAKGSLPLGKTVPTVSIYQDHRRDIIEIRISDRSFHWSVALSAQNIFHMHEAALQDLLFKELNHGLARVGLNVMVQHQKKMVERMKSYAIKPQDYYAKPSYIWDQSGPEMTWPD